MRATIWILIALILVAGVLAWAALNGFPSTAVVAGAFWVVLISGLILRIVRAGRGRRASQIAKPEIIAAQTWENLYLGRRPTRLETVDPPLISTSAFHQPNEDAIDLDKIEQQHNHRPRP